MIDATSIGIWQTGHSTIVKYSGKGIITGTLEKALRIHRANFYSWDPGTLEIKDFRGGYGIDLMMSNASIYNLDLLNFGDVGSGYNQAISVNTNSSLALEDAEISGSTDGVLVNISNGSIGEIRDSTLTVGRADAGFQVDAGSRLNFSNSTISGSVTDNLMNIEEGSSAKIRESTITATTDGNSDSGIYLSETSTLELRESKIDASHRGLAVQRNSYAELRNGSSITAGVANSAVTVYGGAGLKIRSGSSVVSTGASAIDVSQSSWVEIDGGDGSTINRTDDGDDISVSTMGLLSVYSGNSIGSVSCSSKGYVSVGEGSVTTLPDSCTQ